MQRGGANARHFALKRLPLLVSSSTTVAALAFLLWLVSDYGRVWVHPE
jgi:hypothetical protein